MAAVALDAGAEKPQGAENSALKNKAPFSLTPLRISENASIRTSGLSAKFPDRSAKESPSVSRSEQIMATLGHGPFQ
jgi:hypothetical protein